MANEEEIKTGEYGNFDDAQGKVETLNKNLDEHQKGITENKTKLADENIFAGPIADACAEELTKLDSVMTGIATNFSSIGEYIGKAVANYKKGDQEAIEYLSLKDNGVIISSTPVANQDLANSLTSEIGKRSGDYSDSPVGFTPGEWCADFVSYMLRKNGYNYDWAKVAGVNDSNTIFRVMKDKGAEIHYEKYSAKQGKTPDSDYVPQAGDVFLINTNNKLGVDHVGFVIKENGDGTVTTIEGNTYKEGQKYDGSGVVEQHIRSKDDIYGYATPTKG